MSRYAVVTTVDIPAVSLPQGGSTLDYPVHSVVNVIVLDDPAQYAPPENTMLVQSDILNIGDVYTGA